MEMSSNWYELKKWKNVKRNFFNKKIWKEIRQQDLRNLSGLVVETAAVINARSMENRTLAIKQKDSIKVLKGFWDWE